MGIVPFSHLCLYPSYRSEGYEKILTGAYEALDQMLERKLFDQPTPLNLTVSGRLKEKYSLWRKMERKRIDEQRSITLDDIHDVVAMRIIINIDREADEPESEWRGVTVKGDTLDLLGVLFT